METNKVSGETTMKAKEFVKTVDEGKGVFRESGNPLINLTLVKHPTGTYVYMDVVHSIFVTVDRIEAVAENEILGWAGGAPVLTIKTEEWF